MFKISNAQTPLTNQTIASKSEELCISTFRSSIKAQSQAQDGYVPLTSSSVPKKLIITK